MRVAEMEEKDLRSKLSYLTSQFEKLTLDYSRLCSEQKSEVDSVSRSNELALIEEKSRLQSEMSREISRLQEQNARDQEDLRRREKELFEKELNKLKSHYEKREKETSVDLLKLERLHTDRVSELEAEAVTWRAKVDQVEGRERDWNHRLQEIIRDHDRQLQLHSKNAFQIKEVSTE
jgi:hypothetical protein